MKVGVTTTLPPGRLPIRRHIWKAKPSPDIVTPKPQLSPADVPTPPAGTPAPRLLSADVTPPPRMKSQADLTPPPRRVRPTPGPTAPLIRASLQPTLLAPAQPAAQGIHLAKGTLTGLSLLMFSFGVITTVLVDRYWPTRKADWATAPAQVQAASAAAPAPAAAAGTTEADPPSPSVEPMPVDMPPSSVTKAAPAATTAPAARPEPNQAPGARTAPAQGRNPAAKRPGTGRPAGSPTEGGDRTMAPTGTWVDPFE